ncbi:MAG TPA: dihydrodipicolinate synthase family protein [Pirellulaceae bacterium]|nr:dihydrodipicolinate synthase family protein [Pirellulaceae bacterium]
MRSSDITELVRDPIGVYPQATVACFDPTSGELPRRRLDESRTVQFLEALARAGAPALLIGASTGHGHLRTPAELAQWFRVAAKAQVGNCLRTALLRPEDGPDENARLLDLLAELSYPVVFVRPGTNLGKNASDASIADNMRPIVELAAERHLAVGLYSIPDVSGCPMSPDAAADLVQGPGGEQIVAIKVTEANYDKSTLRFLADSRLARLKIVQGWDPYLARALRDGPAHDAQGRQRCGVTSGPMSFAVHQYLHMFVAAARGDWDELAIAQTAVTVLFQAMQDDPGKFADLQRAKYIMGLGQPLIGTVTSDQVERVLSALRSLPRKEDRQRLARSLDLMGDGAFHRELAMLSGGV